MSRAPAPAKINLALVVGPLRDDGKHEVLTVFQRIDLVDRIELEEAPELTVDGFAGDTLVAAALRELARAAGIKARWRVAIEKKIPVAAGLGGGSSDAATALRLANETLSEPLPAEDLHRLAAQIGADVPFFLAGTNAFAAGIGERLVAADVAAAWYAVVKPETSLATADVFASPTVAERVAAARIAGFSGPRPGVDAEPGGHGEAGSRLVEDFGANDLQAAAEGLCPDVRRAAAALERIYGNSRMTGSGSAVFARAGSGPAPSAAMPGDWPSGWSGRMCRSLERHPLAGWAGRGETGEG